VQLLNPFRNPHLVGIVVPTATIVGVCIWACIEELLSFIAGSPIFPIVARGADADFARGQRRKRVLSLLGLVIFICPVIVVASETWREMAMAKANCDSFSEAATYKGLPDYCKEADGRLRTTVWKLWGAKYFDLGGNFDDNECAKALHEAHTKCELSVSITDVRHCFYLAAYFRAILSFQGW
jgi:hypothetical protein